MAYRIIRWLVTVGVVAWLIAAAVRDWPSIQSLRWTGRPLDASLATLFVLQGLLTLPLGLRILHRRTGNGHDVGAFTWRWWLQPFVYRYVPGKVMLVAERIRLGQMIGVPPGTSTVFVLWESIFQLIGGCLVVAVLLPWVGARAASLGWGVGVGIAGGLVVLAILPRIIRWLEATPSFQRRVGDIESPKLRSIDVAALVLVYALAWSGLGLSFFFVARSFSDVGYGHGPSVVLWYVAAYVLGWLSSVSPAGLGLREGILVFGLSDLLGIGPSLAIAAASRVWMTVTEFSCAAVSTRLRPPTDDAPASGHA